MNRRNRGDEVEHGLRKAPAESGDLPLFGGGDAPSPQKKELPKAGKRYIEQKPSWDAIRQDHGSVMNAPEEKIRARMRPDVALNPPAAKGSATSALAAAAMKAKAPRQAYLVYCFIKAQGARGATREEITNGLSVQLGGRPQRLSAITARCRALYLMGLIGSNGDTRINPATDSPNDVLLHEDHVDRWQDDQQRPAQKLKEEGGNA